MTVATTSPDDADMAELMNKWNAENNVGDDVDSDGSEVETDDDAIGYDDMLEKYRREVNVTNNAFDHAVVGTPDLDKAVDEFEALTGVRPLMVVTHNGLGIKSARVAFEQCAFLEIIGPDPTQSSMPLALKLAKLPEGKFTPVHYAVRNTKSCDMKNSTWSDLGFECDQVTMVAKDRGMPWKWDMFFLENSADDGEVNGLVPFFVNWGDSHHAAGRLPIVGDLGSVVVRSPSDSKIHNLLSGVNDMSVEEGGEFFEISFSSPKGKQTFSGSSLVGVSFPK